MKKLLFVLVLFSSFAFSQEENIGDYRFYFEEYPENSKLTKKEEWYKLTPRTYVMYFSQSPIGIKKSIEHVEFVLYRCNLNFNKPNSDKSFLSSVVDSVRDYENLDLTIKNEMSEIKKSWVYNNEVAIFLFLTKDNYEVSIMKLK